jgi:CRISPR-associated protein Cas1
VKRLVVDGYGKFVGQKGDRIVVREKGKTLHHVVAGDLRQVVISGKGGISFDAIELLGVHGVDLVVVNWKGKVTARLSPPIMRTVKTRREQYYAYRDKRGGYLAKEFITAKMKNQYAVLGTLAKSRKETSPDIAEKLTMKRGEVSDQIGRLGKVECSLVDASRELLMGLEGLASHKYWEGLGEIIPEEFGFEVRSGRYAEDGVNAMFNYGYALLEGEVWRGIHYAGLDPYGGFLHVDRPGRPSLVLDLMEEFRQQLIDKTVISLVTKGSVSPSNFEIKQGVCMMDDAARKLLLRTVLDRFERYMRYRGEKRRWTDMILFQARLVAKFLRGEAAAYEGFYLRW